ncbi:hypothetical protein F66182_1331 [Fusarium sp. NRRL 66182]|nr:hypothetical protein F66182_1331 [Fusarium sp. NRRL 66182]
MAYTTGIMPLRQVHKPPFTVEAPDYPKVAGETIPRRHVKYKDGLINSPAEGVHTVFDIIQRSARLYPDNHAVGYRKLVKLHKETKRYQKKVDGETREVEKDWQYSELTPFSFITYKDYEQLILKLGCGLRRLGLGQDKKLFLSGTTRQGACITHQSLVAAGYLLLAHILEMAMENLVFFFGGAIGYGNPRTLSDTSVKNCAGDMRALQPTVMVGVPQIWETVRKGIMSKLETSSLILRMLFWGAVGYKNFISRNKLPGESIFDGLVFSKARQLTGGRLRFTMNGGSGISEDTKQFVSLVLAPMLAGYGLSETCATGSLGCPLEYTSTAIGPIPGSCEAKLVSIPDLGYDADAKVPQGEIWLRGMPIMKEYFKDPEETRRALTLDGWFKTGDIGEFDVSGHLRVIDRVKNLVKMQGGEYIALEKVEAVYRGSQVVANVMVEADMPNDKVLATKAQDLDVDEHSMYSDHRVRTLVLKELQTTGRRAGLVEMEIVSGVVVTDEEWTPTNVGDVAACGV